MSNWLLMVFVALILWGITGVTQKLSTNHISAEYSFVWFAMAFVPIAILVMLAEGGAALLKSPGIIVFASVGGVLNGLGALTSFMALERDGKASVVIPLVALYPLVTVVIAYLFLGETVTAMQWIGVSMAVAAGVLLSRETEDHP
jgi:transporter family protein